MIKDKYRNVFSSFYAYHKLMRFYFIETWSKVDHPELDIYVSRMKKYTTMSTAVIS